MARRIGLVLLAALTGPAPTSASAQQVSELRVRVDNDNFSFWLPREERGDHEYTHGMWLTVTTRSAPGWGRWFADARPVCGEEHVAGACLQTDWELGQRIYTPRFNAVDPVEGDRPHAGWLYGAATAIVQREVDRHAVRLELGVTGPPSLAGPLQRAVHQALGYWEPVGWHNQIPFEPGVLLGYEYGRRLAVASVRGGRVGELTSRAGASAGNVITGAHGELNARLGFNVPRSWGTGPGIEAHGPSVYALAGVRVDGYLRNLFLDGSTGRESLHVDKYPLVQRHYVGLAARIREVELAYIVTTRTREYRTEPSGHRYSSFELTLRR